MSELNIVGTTTTDLTTFESEGYSDTDSLALAQGLLEDAVPCLATLYPDMKESDKLLAKYAVLEMAKYIKIDYFNFERSTSPFQSETIGSYSYAKISSAVQMKALTGVPRFDSAVARFVSLCEDADTTGAGAISASSEEVFTHGYEDYMANKLASGATYPYPLSVWGTI